MGARDSKEVLANGIEKHLTSSSHAKSAWSGWLSLWRIKPMLKEKNYGSKKKNRLMAFMRREGARAARKFYDNALDKAFKSGNIEDAAKLMGVKLKC